MEIWEAFKPSWFNSVSIHYTTFCFHYVSGWVCSDNSLRGVRNYSTTKSLKRIRRDVAQPRSEVREQYSNVRITRENV